MVEPGTAISRGGCIRQILQLAAPATASCIAFVFDGPQGIRVYNVLPRVRWA